MKNAFSIESNSSDAELAFVEHEGDYFTVELRGREVSAVRRVWGYTDCLSLAGLLGHLATQTRGWNTPREWASIESELALRFRSDRLGHVVVEIELTHNRGREDWRVKAEIETELGQLPKIAREADLFFRS